MRCVIVADARRDAAARNARRHAVVRRIFFVGVVVEVVDHLPVFRLVNRSVGSNAPEQAAARSACSLFCGRLVFRGNVAISRPLCRSRVTESPRSTGRCWQSGWGFRSDCRPSVPDTREVRVSISRARRGARRLRRGVRRAAGLRRLLRDHHGREEAQRGGGDGESAQ